MKKIFLLSMIVSTIFIFSGCGARGPQFQSFEKPKDPNNGMVYIYRKAQLFGDALNYKITTNNNYLGDMKINGYTNKELPSGIIKLYASTTSIDKITFKFELPKNKIICIKTYIGFGIILGRPKFEIVDMNKCKKEIKDTKKLLD